MAVADYWGLLGAIKTAIESETSALTPVPVVVVERPFSMQDSWVGIMLDRRDAPQDEQALVAGKRTRFRLRIPIWCWRYAVDTDLAAQLMLGLLATVEKALMTDHTFAGKCNMSWVEGGAFTQLETNNGVTYMGGETVLIADISSIID